MTEDFEKSDPSETEPAEPEAELPSPFNESGPPPLPEDIEEAAAEESVTPPPLPEVVIKEASPEVEEVAPPLPEALTETEVLGAPSFEAPEPEPVGPPAQQPITFGPPPDTIAPPPVTPAPQPIEMSPAEQATPKKNNQTLIIVLIVVAVLLFLCCCCVLPVGLILANLDEIMWELGLHLLTFV
ncbi:MAG: hypothetical protein JXR84_10055 [Anaerolineae bacterium]|nr:hypothetical protein [Anaerolineae bacterium]